MYWIFCYLDRSYLLQSSRSLHEVAIELFRRIVFENDQLKTKIVMGACDLVDADRTGQTFDSSLLRDTIAMFHELSVYTSVFEPAFLEKSQSYIMTWSEQASSSKNLADYVRSSVKLMDQEMIRCDLYSLDSTTRRDMLVLLEKHLVQLREDRLGKLRLDILCIQLITRDSESR